MSSHWTESQIIRMIAQHFGHRADITSIGIGDDCACIREDLRLITTDASIEGVHFDLSWMSLADAAYRCMASNVSDVAAMGAYAGAFTLALGLRPDLSFDEIEAAIAALAQCVRDHGLENCWLVGGDVVRSPVVMFSVTVLGKTPEWPVVTRSGAHPGDAIYLVGNAGYAAAGLELCRQNLDRCPEFEPFLKAFCRPLVQTTFGPLVARHGLATAMMDTSDGLFTDLPRLLEQSHIGATVYIDRLKPDNALAHIAQITGKNARDWMICGGEDFGLIVTVSAQNCASFERLAGDTNTPYQKIGTCTEQTGIKWFERNHAVAVCDQSFSHF